MQTIYEPKGKAKEYGELALNIYTGCTHGCTYCYAPSVLRKDRMDFHSFIEPRENILEETKKRLAKGDIKGKEIFLCFTCDPFPTGIDCSVTYDIIRAIKESGNNVAILTKGRLCIPELFRLMDNNDRFGVTISCSEAVARTYEPNAVPVFERLEYIRSAKKHGIITFVSCEPVLQQAPIFQIIVNTQNHIDEFRIGKLNYHESSINWKEFGETCEYLCKTHGRKYLIKEGLRAEMNKEAP
jgi:DNA repair photolyase